MADPIYAGSDVEVSFEIRNASGTLTDPTTVTAQHILPNGSRFDVSVTNDGVGLYHCNFTDMIAGNHKLAVTGVGVLGVTGTGSWYITPTNY
jgi:hypothetical protein